MISQTDRPEPLNPITNTSPMNTKHTPGPWNTASLDQDSAHMEVFAGTSDGEQVAVVKGYDLSTGKFYEAIANARLIKEAPNLLKALQTLVQMTGNIGEIERFLNTKARTAIAKATGNTSADL